MNKSSYNVCAWDLETKMDTKSCLLLPYIISVCYNFQVISNNEGI